MTASGAGHWRSATGRAEFGTLYRAAFKEMPTPTATVDVGTSFGTVRVYRFEGARSGIDPIVLLPGRASASPVWSGSLPALLGICDVYTVDLLGEPGMSVQDRPIATDADQAAWLDEVLEKLPEPRFNVIGLSIGGWAATNLALRHGTRLASLVLIDPMNVLADLPLWTILRSLPASLPWLPKSWRNSFNAWTAGGAPVRDDPVARMIEAGMRAYALRLPSPARIPKNELRRLQMPVLAIVAGRSVMHHGEDARDTAIHVFGVGSTRYYPDASHAIIGECMPEVVGDIAAFLRARRHR